MADTRYMLNGELVEHSAFVISGDDEGLMRGRAVFETLRTHRGALFRPEAHVARLCASAEALGLGCPSPDLLLDEVQVIASGYPLPGKVNIILTSGGARLLRIMPLDRTRLCAPIRAATRRWEPPPWLDGRSKHCSRALNEAAVRDAGVDEVFWLGSDGAITEATRSNAFAVIDGQIVTPPDDGRILMGVTRAALIEAAAVAGLPLIEAPIFPDADFTELYASSTLKDLAPVVELDGRKMATGGPVGATLHTALIALMDAEAER